MSYPISKYSEEIKEQFVKWINKNLKDPYEQATNKTRDNFVFGDDINFKVVNIFPIIHVSMGDFNSTKISSQTKTAYLEEEEHNLIIFYYNQNGHKYAFEDGESLTNEAQCRKYLQYIKNKIKANADKFDEYCHKITFGTIPKPTFNKNTRTFMSMLPVTVYTYKR